jgi:hypothetical protein
MPLSGMPSLTTVKKFNDKSNPEKPKEPREPEKTLTFREESQCAEKTQSGKPGEAAGNHRLKADKREVQLLIHKIKSRRLRH